MMEFSINSLQSNDPLILKDALDKFSSQKFEQFKRTDGVFQKWTSIIPFKYEKYCKIFHPIYQSRIDYGNETWETWDRKQNKEIGSSDIEEFLKTTTLISSSFGDDEESDLINWKSLSESMSIKYGPHLSVSDFDSYFNEINLNSWPRNLERPQEGYWSSSIIKEAFSLAHKSYKNIFLWLYYDTKKVLANVTELLGEESENYSTVLKGGKVFGHLRDAMNKSFITPELMFPLDRSFCLLADYDESSTMLGGTKEFVSQFISSTKIEAIEFSEDSLSIIHSLNG